MAKKKTNAEFQKEVRALVGNEYTVLEKYESSRKRIKIKHNVCGNIYKITPAHFIQGERCPKCQRKARAKKHTKSNSWFKNKVNKLAGNEYTFLETYINNSTKISVKHNLCGKIYKVSPHNFLYGYKCPYCSANAKKSNLEFLNEVKKQVGNEYTFLEPYISNDLKIKVRHNKCKHIYKVRPCNFLRGARCPHCRSSKGEREIIKYAKSHHLLFQTQFKISQCKDQRALPFDVAIFNSNGTLNSLIEYQGCQHFYSKYDHKNHGIFESTYQTTIKHDTIKAKYCNEHHIKLIYIFHPQQKKSYDSIPFIRHLVTTTLDRELQVS